MVRGPRLGVDVGTVRVGLAASDPDGLIATPVATLERGAGDVDAIVSEVHERGAQMVYVGLPRHLSGAEGTSAGLARAYSEALALAVAPVPVRLVDERMSTVSAHRALSESGRPGRRHRAVVDQAAAVMILQDALDFERATGRRPGERVDVQQDGARRGRGDGSTTNQE